MQPNRLVRRTQPEGCIFSSTQPVHARGAAHRAGLGRRSAALL